MKDVYQLLEQKEADLARVRREIEGLQFIASMNRTTQAVLQELATWICCVWQVPLAHFGGLIWPTLSC